MQLPFFSSTCCAVALRFVAVPTLSLSHAVEIDNRHRSTVAQDARSARCGVDSPLLGLADTKRLTQTRLSSS